MPTCHCPSQYASFPGNSIFFKSYCFFEIKTYDLETTKCNGWVVNLYSRWKTKPVSIDYDKPLKLTKFQKFNVIGFSLKMGSGGCWNMFLKLCLSKS